MNKNAQQKPEISDLMQDVSAYIAKACRRGTPPAVTEATKHHLLDTLAAIISGSRLLPGKVALAYTKALGTGRPEACVPGSRIVTTAQNAAFASGMLAHADETDDSHAASFVHPGCGIVPAALAVAEKKGADGQSLLRATTLGYDIAVRMAFSLGAGNFFGAGRCVHSFATLFGASAAAAALSRFDTRQIRHLLSYTCQSASGVGYYHRDVDHIEKSYAHGAKSARDAVAIAAMIEAGFTGVDDAFSGDKHFYFAFKEHAKPNLLGEQLGERYEVTNTGIKRWTTGAPTQAVLDSLAELIKLHGVTASQVDKATVRTYTHGFHVVNNRALPDICMQHLVAVMLIDGTVTFDSSHDVARMRERKVLELRKRVDFSGDDDLERAYRGPEASRQAIVELQLRDGRVLRHHTTAVRGTRQNPMNRDEVDDKCYWLIAPVLGKNRTRQLIDAVWNLERVNNVRALRKLMQR